MRALILTVLISVFSISIAQASFLIEPYLGYSLGSGEQTVGSGKADLGRNKPTFGARLGLQYFGLMAGADYSMSSGDMEIETTGTTLDQTTKDGTKKSQLGIFVGYELPILLRFWGTYYLNAGLDGDDAVGGTQQFDIHDEYSGSGYGLGVGFTFLPFMSLNIEYRSFTYDEWKDKNNTSGCTKGSFGDACSSGLSDVDLQEILLSVSIPINL